MSFFHSVECDNEQCGNEESVAEAFPRFHGGCPVQGDVGLTDADGNSGTDWRLILVPASAGRTAVFVADSDACEDAVRALYAGEAS